jgi:hypothetical protein
MFRYLYPQSKQHANVTDKNSNSFGGHQVVRGLLQSHHQDSEIIVLP